MTKEQILEQITDIEIRNAHLTHASTKVVLNPEKLSAFLEQITQNQEEIFKSLKAHILLDE